MNKKITQSGSPLLILALTLITLGITPFYSYDPINIFRFMAVLIFGLSSIGMCFRHYKILLSKVYRKVLVSSFIFLIWIIVISINSNMNFPDTLFGVSGRNTGLLTYISLLFLMLFASLKRNILSTPNVIHSLFFCGMISVLYGLIQALGLDPFDWINPYSPVFGFFGNPNFQASFMGIAAVAGIAMSLESSAKLQNRIGLLVFVALALFNIFESRSQQGYLVFIAGVVVVGYLYVRGSEKLRRLTSLYVVAAVVGFVAVVLDILQKSPWSSILYKESVTFRGDFWRAGWKMTADNPVFGVGLDGYRDHYRASRDVVTALRPGSDAMTDSAHNVFLDISSGGGFPLLIIYVFLIGLTIFSAIRVIRRCTGFNVAFAAVLGAWVAYLAQSLISINQLGLAVWGWVLMGVIIGYEINTREKADVIKIKPIHSTAAIGMGLIIGLGVGLPLMVADATVRSTVKSGDVIKIEASVRQWPQSVSRMTLAAQILRKGNLPERSIVIAREAVVFNPMNFEAWKELSLQPNATEQERAEALVMMKKLDPFNPNLK